MNARLVVFVAVLAVLCSTAYCAKPEPLSDVAAKFVFENWKLQHSKSYASVEEENARFGVFRSNLELIRAHNAEGHSFFLRMNEFGDLGTKEFKRRFTGFGSPAPKPQADRVHQYTGGDLPSSVNWVTAGAVTPVKNQGSCGSCWSFSTTGAMEGAYQIKNKNLVSFSEQQLVDCDRASGDQGCNGGLMDNAFGYIAQKGLETEASYPYRGVDGTCAYDASKVVAGSQIAGFTDVKSFGPPINSDALASAVAQQPVSVAVYAADLFWQFYGGGVFDHKTCKNGQNDLDHGVLAVGYDTDAKSGKQFWLVKNSWGPSWGDQGYIKLLKGASTNECGILDQPSYPHF